MVNVGFPGNTWYGFEMVDAPDACHPSHGGASIENLQRIESVGLFANFRQIKLNAITCDLSRTVNQEPIAGTTAAGSKETGLGMFFLLRLAFWLGLVLVLLPREKTTESDKPPQIGASEAVQAATAAVSDMSQFCKRQPAACDVGGQAATAIGQRAQGGARKLYQIITDKKSSDPTGSIGSAEDAEPSLPDMAPRDTLTADDLAAEWRVPPTP
jgi:Family of unknown function (DUF5330)